MGIVIPHTNSPDAEFETLWLRCQNKIGSGSSRDVFAIPDDANDKVLKVSNKPINFCNWSEIIIYTRANENDKKFFAKVISWSFSGRFLVMERLGELPKNLLLCGHEIPACIADKKRQNFGLDKEGTIKLLDYASFDFHSTPLFTMPQPIENIDCG